MSERSANGLVQAGGDPRPARENGSAPGRGISAQGRVLLLDVDAPFREALVRALHRFEIEVSWRARVLGLFDAIAEADPIALVVGADLPGSDPLQLIRSVRRSRWRELPILVIFDRPDRRLELRAYVDGADAVLERARAPVELAAHIVGHATRRWRRRQSAARELADAALALTTTGSGERAEARVSDSAHAPAGWSIDPAPLPATSGSGDAWAGSLQQAAGVVSAPGPIDRETHPRAVDHCPACGSRSTEPSHPAPHRPASSPVPEAGLAPRLADAAVPEVILVDDDPSLLEMLRYALTNRGYRTLSLSNGLDALRALRDLDTGDRRPVVLLDVDLPGLDGFRILHELGVCRPGDYQVILCTIHSSEATQVLGIQSGAVDYIVKPFRMPVVLAKVERLLGPARVSARA